jgi:large subunit ribosomal protein L7Ae
MVKAKSNTENSVWEEKKRNYGIGRDIQHKRDVTRFTRWPKYILLQRRKQVLQKRLKVPPSINQFNKTMDSNSAANVLKLLKKYQPEDKAAKKDRLLKLAESGSAPSAKKPLVVKHGLNHVVKLIEDKKATFVVIAHDVDPIELVLYLPALCKKNDIPYCIIKGKGRLGKLVHMKTATAVALTGVRSEDQKEFANVVEVARSQFNDQYEENRKRWGGGIMGLKSQAILARYEKQREKELMEKMKYQ